MKNKTDLKVDDKTRLQIFLMYHRQPFDDGQYGKLNYGQILAHNIHFEGCEEDGYSYCICDIPLAICSIVLKPLEKISDEHKLSIAKIAYPNTKWAHTVETGGKIVRAQEQSLREEVISGFCASQITDQLREWGYATPYKNFSVDDLVEEGVFKIIK